jgi:hypothetical protein
MSSILADHLRGEGGGGCGVSANEYSCANGAQINFRDLTPYLTYAQLVRICVLLKLLLPDACVSHVESTFNFLKKKFSCHTN